MGDHRAGAIRLLYTLVLLGANVSRDSRSFLSVVIRMGAGSFFINWCYLLEGMELLERRLDDWEVFVVIIVSD